MKLILVRHGRSLANEAKINQESEGKWRDTDLHKRGIQQAKDVSHRLGGEKIDLIYSSPLKRAKQTAEEISKSHKIKIIFDKRLEERNRNKETKEDFVQRCKSFFDEMKDSKKNILLVSHGGVILTLLAISTGNKKTGGDLVKEIYPLMRNTSISIIKRVGDVFERPLIGCVEHRSDKKRKKTKSVGAIIIHENKFLIVKKSAKYGGHWDFPKGAIKREETDEIKTLHREIKEETNLNIKLIPNFYEEIHYNYSDDYYDYDKTVGYYLAKPLNVNAHPKDEEIEKCKWVDEVELKEKITFQDSIEVFKKAKEFLSK